MGKMLIVKGLQAALPQSQKRIEIADGHINGSGTFVPNGTQVNNTENSGWYTVKMLVEPGEILQFVRICGTSSFGGLRVRYCLFQGSDFDNMKARDLLCPDQTFTVPGGCHSMTLNLPVSGSIPSAADNCISFDTVPTIANTKIIVTN